MDRGFNASIDTQHRLTGWENWKAALLAREAGTSVRSDAVRWIASFRHGSEDSRDADVLYQVSSWPSRNEIQRFCSGSGQQDRNLFCVTDGAVSRCWKGLPDEVNNALFTTYHLHCQEYMLPIKAKVMRSVVGRVVVSLRSMYAHCVATLFQSRLNASVSPVCF